MAQQEEKNARQQCPLRKEKEDNARRQQFGFSLKDDNLICVFCPFSISPNRMRPAKHHAHMSRKINSGKCLGTNYDDKTTNKDLTGVKGACYGGDIRRRKRDMKLFEKCGGCSSWIESSDERTRCDICDDGTEHTKMEYHALHTGKIGRNDTSKTMESHVLHTGKTIDADISGCLVQFKNNQSAAAVPAAAIAPIDDEHTRGHLHPQRETTPPTTSTLSRALPFSPGSQGVQAQQKFGTLHTIPLPGATVNLFDTTEQARRFTGNAIEAAQMKHQKRIRDRDAIEAAQKPKRDRDRGDGCGRYGGDQGRDRVRYDDARDRSRDQNDRDRGRDRHREHGRGGGGGGLRDQHDGRARDRSGGRSRSRDRDDGGRNGGRSRGRGRDDDGRGGGGGWLVGRPCGRGGGGGRGRN